MQFVEGICQAPEILVLLRRANVQIGRHSTSTVQPRGHPADKDVLHVVAIKHLDDPLQVQDGLPWLSWLTSC